MPFTTTLRLAERTGARWALAAPLRYDGAVDHWRVPTGFQTDLASIPRVLAGLALRDDPRSNRAAVLHDWFCVVGIVTGAISARDADGVFRRTLREGGVGPVMRWLMWTGVRLGALGTPHRRAGWWRDAPAVFAISTAALVPVLAVAVVGGGVLAVVWLVERLLAVLGVH